MIAILVFAAIDVGGYPWQTGNQIHSIIKHRIPIFFFVHTGSIAFGKLAFGLQSHDGYYKLRHWMRGYRQRFNSGKYMIRHMASALPNGCDMLHVIIGWQ